MRILSLDWGIVRGLSVLTARSRTQATRKSGHFPCSRRRHATSAPSASLYLRRRPRRAPSDETMITEDQSAVIAFLAEPSTHGGARVERIDTHASIVFLAGERAYKLKRAVLFDYLDFSTSAKRRVLCEAEVRLNRRTAPNLYRGVVAITRRDDGSYAFGGQGTPVDWLVEMNRFPQEALFDRLASAGHLDLELMSPLAAAIAAFHMSAEHRADHGGKAGMSWVIDGNAAGFAEFGRACLEPSTSYRVTDDSCRELDRRAELLERRRESGFVRQCHGDLHLRNIVLLDGATDAVRRRRVQRRDLVHRCPVRSRVSLDGSLAATAPAARERRLEPLSGRDRRSQRRASLAAVLVVPSGGAREDERHGRAASE